VLADVNEPPEPAERERFSWPHSRGKRRAGQRTRRHWQNPRLVPTKKGIGLGNYGGRYKPWMNIKPADGASTRANLNGFSDAVADVGWLSPG
jgi:hypothetical protein